MPQPTDRLGQPLSVGDWVEFDEYLSPNNKNNGRRWQVAGFGGEYMATNEITGYRRRVILVMLGDRETAISDSLTKITPKQETTTWSDMADIWAPEGVNV